MQLEKSWIINWKNTSQYRKNLAVLWSQKSRKTKFKKVQTSFNISYGKFKYLLMFYLSAWS